MFADTVKDAHCLTLLTLGLRNLYGKKQIHNMADIKNLKVRVQATPTEDAMFPAYGAQTVHMPFGSVYTSLQTGVIDMAENGVNVYDSNKHYEVAPIMSMTGHEANCNLLWVSDKAWSGLSDEQKGWVTAAAIEVATKEPAMAIELGAQVARQAGEDGHSVRRSRGQVRLHRRRDAVAGQDRRGSGTARDEDRADLPDDHLDHTHRRPTPRRARRGHLPSGSTMRRSG